MHTTDADYATMTGEITSDGFYGGSNNFIAIDGGEYELANDCVVINVNTDNKSGIEGDAKAAAREARAGYDNIVYVVDSSDKIVFIMIDGKNNEIKDTTPPTLY